MSPEPPSLECFRSSNFSFHAYTFKISRHALDYLSWHPTLLSKHNSPFPISPEFPSFFLSFPLPRKNLTGAIPLYKLYRYVPPFWVDFCAIFDLKTGNIRLSPFWSGIGLAFEGTTRVYERICRFNSK